MKIELEKHEKFVNGKSEGKQWRITLYRNYNVLGGQPQWDFFDSLKIEGLASLIKLRELVDEAIKHEPIQDGK